MRNNRKEFLSSGDVSNLRLNRRSRQPSTSLNKDWNTTNHKLSPVSITCKPTPDMDLKSIRMIIRKTKMVRTARVTKVNSPE